MIDQSSSNAVVSKDSKVLVLLDSYLSKLIPYDAESLKELGKSLKSELVCACTQMAKDKYDRILTYIFKGKISVLDFCLNKV